MGYSDVLRRGVKGGIVPRRYLATLAVLVLSGCAAISPALDRGRVVTDQALQGAERFMCRIAPVGPVMDRYFTDQKKYEAWRTLCARDPVTEIAPIAPAE